MIPKHITKPEDISPGIKIKPQHSSGLPENFVMTVQKQSQKFNPNCSKTIPKLSPDCPKIIPKISKNSYTQSKNLRTEIYGLSRPLSQSTTIKWPLCGVPTLHLSSVDPTHRYCYGRSQLPFSFTSMRARTHDPKGLL